MEELAPAKAAPTTDQLIAMCGKAISRVMSDETGDDNDPDRIWILRRIHKSYLYYRNLQNFAPAMFAGIVDVTGTNGAIINDDNGLYDYSQNIFRGYCRKLEAVLGNRMPNAIAVPNNPDDEEAIRAARSANSAALYVREECDLQLQSLYLVFGHFNFGTMFWHLDWVIDGDKYGTKPVQEPGPPQPQALGDAAFICPACAQAVPAQGDNPQPPGTCPNCGAPMGLETYKPPTMANVPTMTVKNVEKGGLQISLHGADEVSVPLDAASIDDCDWLRYEREKSKAKLLKKWGDKIRDVAGANVQEISTAGEYAEKVRSAMGSPIGLVREKRVNRWTECDDWWTPAEIEMVDDEAIRKVLRENFPKGLRITSVRGKIVDLKQERLQDRWQECKPEPATRIMADPLGDDWMEVQDIEDNILNQCSETIDRSNEPGFADPTRLDMDAYQNRRSEPADLIPALRPAGGKLSDIIYRPEPVLFSDQIGPFGAGVEERAKNIGGLLDPIWGGGDAEEPTARQAELKKNAALMQLGVEWTMIGRAIESVYEKACKLLAENEDGVLAFSQKNAFGRYSTLSVVVADLKDGKYHFEADEAIPMTWGQQRDLLMWMLDKPAALLTQWGLDDPLNVPEFKRLLGMPGERVPLEDDREKGMDIIGKLLQEKPAPGPAGPAGPDGQPTPGQLQSSIQPDWEDNHAFLGTLARAYLTVNSALKTENADGYQNIQLWGQAQEAAGNAPPPPAPPKASVSVSLKGPDLGDPAVQAALTGSNIIPQGTQVQAVPPPIKAGMMPPPMGAAPSGPPQ